MSFFHPLENQYLKENSAKGVYELFRGRYNVKNVEQTGVNTYYVKTQDGSQIKVRVGEKTNLFGEKRSVVRTVENKNLWWF